MKIITKFEDWRYDFTYHLYEVADFWDLKIIKLYNPGSYGYAAVGELPSGKEVVLKLTVDYNEAKLANYLQKRTNYSRLVNYLDIRSVVTKSGEPLNLSSQVQHQGNVYALLMEKLDSWVKYRDDNGFDKNCVSYVTSRLTEDLEYGLDHIMNKDFPNYIKINNNSRKASWFVNEMKLIMKDLYTNKFILKEDDYENDIHGSNLGIRKTPSGDQLVHFDIRNDSINHFKIKRNPIIL